MATFWVENDSLQAEGLTPGSIHDSIVKWEGLRDLCLEGRLVHCGGAKTCSLCWAYDNCRGCPVYEATGLFNCLGTPYGDYPNAVDRRDIATALSAAEEEIVFLQSLLEV